MLPVSVTMFIMSFLGARMSATRTPRWIVKVGLWILLIAVVVLIGTIEPVLEGVLFAISMALLGVGMGLLASQLGNVVQSSVGPNDRSEAGGLQYTAQQLGSSIGTALIGAVVISALGAAFIAQVEQDPRIPPELSEAIGVELDGSIAFVNSSDLEVGLADTGLPPDEIDGIVESYEASQLEALRLGLFVAAVVVVIALFMVRRIPDMSFEEIAAVEGEDTPVETAENS
jgi:hypothetical protein